MAFVKRNGPAILAGLLLGILAVVLLRRGHDQLLRGRQVSGSTFRLPRPQIAQFHLYMFLAGVSFGAIPALTKADRSKRRNWRLAAGAAAPLFLLAVTWDRYGWTWLPDSIHRRFDWLGIEIETAAAIAVGVLVSAALVPAVVSRIRRA